MSGGNKLINLIVLVEVGIVIHVRKYHCYEKISFVLFDYCRQMTCVSDMLQPAQYTTMRRHEKRRIRRERDRLRTEIAKQVDKWMTSTPVTSKFLLQSKSATDGFKSQKRYRLGDTSDHNDTSPSKSETETNTPDEHLIAPKSSPEMGQYAGSPIHYTNPNESKYNLVTGFRKQYKVSTLNGPQQESPRRYKNSRYLFHRSVHDEIEFQKRYRRLFDLNKHLQFVNSSLVSGKNINNQLPPIGPESASNFGMFEINSVQKHNDPIANEEYTDDSDASDYESAGRTGRTRNMVPTDISRYQKLPNIAVNKQLHPYPSSVQNSDLTEIEKFNKLPDIGKSIERCSSPTKEPEKIILKAEPFGTCDDSGIGDRTVTQTTQASECETYPEMKISVNIKFKQKETKAKEEITDNQESKVSCGYDGYYKLPSASHDDNIEKMLSYLKT